MWGNGAMSYITLAINDSSAKTMTENLECVKKVLMTYLKAVKHLGNSRPVAEDTAKCTMLLWERSPQIEGNYL